MRLPPPFVFACILIFIFYGNSKAQDCLSNALDASNVAYTITVSKWGQANFNTIQAAIDSIPLNNNRWVRILISADTYSEQVKVPRDKPCVILEGNTGTTISWGLHTGADKSATFTAEADNFVAKNMAIMNTYRSLLNDVEQSVAVEVTGDKVSFHACSFYGYQDTLWDALGRHYFQNCFIEGAIDFIWGNGQSIYEGCKISILPFAGGQLAGFITAQGRKSANEMTGFVFKGGFVFANGNAHSYLGRAYGAYSRVIWYDIEFSDVIVPEGWSTWNQPQDNLEYAEVNCHGPGSNLSKRVTWLKKLAESDVHQFIDISYIDQDGWLANQP
ncbi:probable pectinesterase 29 [Telopea speciosissima]|uniref:probable pectinesterase 29 n=1 Tax=Telopea speciosissima TaxID=54955 RepID=UPI001CC67779|nr:probable pectinesterase 29 [Telopea speciosissima]